MNVPLTYKIGEPVILTHPYKVVQGIILESNSDDDIIAVHSYGCVIGESFWFNEDPKNSFIVGKNFTVLSPIEKPSDKELILLLKDKLEASQLRLRRICRNQVNERIAWGIDAYSSLGLTDSIMAMICTTTRESVTRYRGEHGISSTHQKLSSCFHSKDVVSTNIVVRSPHASITL